MTTYYLAGPMTGVPHFNYPLFVRAAAELRQTHDLTVMSPVELDQMSGEDIARAAMESPDGDLSKTAIAETWGDFVSRDLKFVVDHCDSIVFLDGWQKSRGARLEALAGLLCGHGFARYVPGVGIEEMSPQTVLTQLVRTTHGELK